jgi:hypothetical protein
MLATTDTKDPGKSHASILAWTKLGDLDLDAGNAAAAEASGHVW